MVAGYSSIERTWEKWYQHPCIEINPRETIYSVYTKTAQTHLHSLAFYVEETGEKYTTQDIIELTDRASGGFSTLNIGSNTRVGIMLNGSIEEVVSFLALSKLGAISKYIDFMKSPIAMMHSIEQSNLDFLIMDESFLALEPVINTAHLPVIVANSRGSDVNSQYILFDDLYEKGASVQAIAAPYVDGRPAVIINSSGTTGEPKPIVHTDYSINVAVQKMLATDYPLGGSNVLVKMIPAHIGLGLITSLYTGLVSGTLVVSIGVKEVPKLIGESIAFVKNFNQFCVENQLLKAKLNIFSTPLFLSAIVKSADITDLSFMGSMLAAGSKITAEELDQLEKIIFSKGCRVPICNGYGQNEMAGAVTLNCNSHNVNGSAGFPSVGTKIMIVDSDTMVPLGLNQTGLILENSNSHFAEYENMPEKTKDAWVVLSDGSRWYNSRDLGYMDKQGFLFITGRTTRVVIRTDFKISLDDIEYKLKTLPYIHDCATIVPQVGGSMEQIIAFVKTDYTDMNTLAYAVASEGILSDFEMPNCYIPIHDVPYKSVGKVDYLALENLSKSMEVGNLL